MVRTVLGVAMSRFPQLLSQVFAECAPVWGPVLYLNLADCSPVLMGLVRETDDKTLGRSVNNTQQLGVKPEESGNRPCDG